MKFCYFVLWVSLITLKITHGYLYSSVVPIAGRTYQIKGAATGYFVTVDDFSYTIMSGNWGAAKQMWIYSSVPDHSGMYQFVNQHSKKCLTASVSAVGEYDCLKYPPSNDQLWGVGSHPTIRTFNWTNETFDEWAWAWIKGSGGKCLEFDGNAPGASIISSNCNGTNGNQWFDFIPS